jgi:hypothetical protein
MADNNVSVLNDLIEVSRDGEEGFRKAAEDAKNPELKTLFSSRATEIGAAVRELQAQVAALGGKPEDHGSVAGALHRGWISLRTAVSDRSIWPSSKKPKGRGRRQEEVCRGAAGNRSQLRYSRADRAPISGRAAQSRSDSRPA